VLILAGSASTKLGISLSEHMDIRLVETEIKRFPDDECYVRILTDLANEDVVIVQPTYPDNNIIELFALQEAVQEFSVKGVTTVIPYYGYARQDKIFKPGETIVARNLARHIEMCTDHIILMDIHAPTIQDHFTKPCANLSSMGQIGNYLKESSPDAILAPDKGAKDRAFSVSKALGCGYDHLEKTRLDGERVEIKPKNMDVNDKFVVIVDDIIATGGTIIKATEQLKSQGASKVWAACAHGLYTSNALPRLQQNVDKVISTDTLESETSLVSCAPAIAKVLEKGVEAFEAERRSSAEDQ
jgi:ribose-phosphate pyrophosphokinase